MHARTLVAWAALAVAPALAQDRGDAPVEIGKTESAEVRLVLVDAVVVDRDGSTVPGLAKDDFEVLSWGRQVEVDTLDVVCSEGALPEPRPVRRASAREGLPATERGRRIALLFDYLHLAAGQREEVFDHAVDMIENGVTDEDEVLIAALTGGLRVEQVFTGDRNELLRSLRRMRYDVTLWNGNFSHQSEAGFVDGMTSLIDVLETVPGRKSIVMYSGMQDVPLDLEFQEIAAAAAAARCALYPVDAEGLREPGLGFGIDPGPT